MTATLELHPAVRSCVLTRANPEKRSPHIGQLLIASGDCTLAADWRSKLTVSPAGAAAWKAERAVERNVRLDIAPMLMLQPVVRYYANVAGGSQRTVVFGFRTRIGF
jgi:hypothetical protein